jgi:hypothetical protein
MQQIIDVFVDESGDLGFSRKSTNYFVIGFIVVSHKERIKTDVKRLLKKLNVRNHKKIYEFKFSNDSKYVRCKMLNLISKSEIEAGQIVVKKSAVRNDLRDKKSILYNFLVAEYVMRDILSSYTNINHINLHLDLSMSKKSREDFDDYFSNKVSWRSLLTGVNQSITNKVYHDYSHSDPCLQMADYLAGSLFQLYEHNDCSFYDIIKVKVVHTHGWGVLN